MEYFDEDPCAPLIVEEMVMEVAPGSAPTRRERREGAGAPAVTIKREFAVALMTFKCFPPAS